MSEGNLKSTSRKHWLRWLAILAAAFLLVSLGSICLGIERAAGEEQIHPADAIVVFGAAEYAGRPSPVYRARLDHALELFERGVAPVIITTGGAASDPQFSEGGVGHGHTSVIPDGAGARSPVPARELGLSRATQSTRAGVRRSTC